ncbi:MAG: hypothetical protein HY068_06990 [Burkholderiales bacterium]|nr:hypothetical protein [Burkholderiales bacterium]
MRVELKAGSFVIEINTSGTLYLRTSKREVFAARDQRITWRSHHKVLKPGEGIWSGWGWEIAYSRLEAVEAISGG